MRTEERSTKGLKKILTWVFGDYSKIIYKSGSKYLAVMLSLLLDVLMLDEQWCAI